MNQDETSKFCVALRPHTKQTSSNHSFDDKSQITPW